MIHWRVYVTTITLTTKKLSLTMSPNILCLYMNYLQSIVHDTQYKQATRVLCNKNTF